MEKFFTTFAIWLIFFTSTKSQTDLRISNYSAVSGTSLTFTVQVKASAGSTPMNTNTIAIAFSSSALVSSLASVTYASNYSAYSNTASSYSSGTLSLTTTAPGSPVNISTSWEDFMTITMNQTGTASNTTDITFGTISGITVGTATGLYNQVMPVKLICFTADIDQQNEVVLKWSTATEENSDQFLLEKSFDGNTFCTIGIKKAAGCSNNIIMYSFVDQNIFSEKVYYRLKQVDFSGKFTYSNLIAVNLSHENLLNVWPNPSVDGKVFIQTSSDVSVSDQLGRLVYIGPANVLYLEKGLYYISSNGIYQKTQKIVVQ